MTGMIFCRFWLEVLVFVARWRRFVRLIAVVRSGKFAFAQPVIVCFVVGETSRARFTWLGLAHVTAFRVRGRRCRESWRRILRIAGNGQFGKFGLSQPFVESRWTGTENDCAETLWKPIRQHGELILDGQTGEVHKS